MNSGKIAFALVGLHVLLLAWGCARPGVVELVREPAATALSPACERISDLQRRKDLALLTDLERRAGRLPESSGARAEAILLLEAVRAEYVTGSRHPWLDEQVAHVQSLLDAGAGAGDATAGRRLAYEAWIAHVRETRGFRLALPLLIRAEQAGLKLESGAQVNDAHPTGWSDRLLALQSRLAALHDAQGVAVTSYSWTKAQAWLDYAADEQAMLDFSGVVDAAMNQSEQIIACLETPSGGERAPRLTAAARHNPPVGAAARAGDFRPDLWRKAGEAGPADWTGHLESPEPVLAVLARLEVALLQAAHEHGQRGPGASRFYQQAAERLAAQLPSPTP